jgi:hypothetical protein
MRLLRERSSFQKAKSFLPGPIISDGLDIATFAGKILKNP